MLQLAVLIDGENVSARFAEELYDRIAELGEPCVHQIFGDWRGGGRKGWKFVAGMWADIELVQRSRFRGVKNAADVMLTIAAMDLMYSATIDGFCLVSADSDFVPLVERIKHQGLAAFGLATSTPSRALVDVCDGYAVLGRVDRAPRGEGSKRMLSGFQRALVARAVQLYGNRNGWAKLSAVDRYPAQKSAAFAADRWGYQDLAAVLHALGSFQFQGKGEQRRTCPAAEGSGPPAVSSDNIGADASLVTVGGRPTTNGAVTAAGGAGV